MPIFVPGIVPVLGWVPGIVCVPVFVPGIVWAPGLIWVPGFMDSGVHGAQALRLRGLGAGRAGCGDKGAKSAMYVSWGAFLLGGGPPANARRGTDVPFAEFLLCPHFATGVACFHKTGENARGLRLHHRRRRLGRLGHGQPAVGEERQPGAAVRGRAGHARGQRAARDPRFLFRHRLFRPALPLDGAQGPHPDRARTTGPTNARPCANTSRPACSAAARRSTASSPIAARPTDYDEWEERAPRAGTGTRCCPISRRSSATWISPATYHGKDGRIPVRRISPDMWCGHAKAVGGRLRAGSNSSDQNGEYVDGYFPITISNLDDRRVSAAIGYLDTETRQPPEPDDLGRDAGRRLMFEGTRCVGVKALVRGQETEFRVIRPGEVIVSSGAIHSPAHLLRAGIGPSGICASMGSRCCAPARRRAAADGPPVGFGVVVCEAARASTG